MDEHEKTARAYQRVEAMTGFYIHLAIYVIVIAILAVINMLTGDDWWVQWVLLGWGAGVLAHALAVFGRSPGFIRTWQLRKIKEIKDKM